VRAWQASVGASYEVARALGGKFGRSSVLELFAGGENEGSSFLSGLRSFPLQAGLPGFTTGRLDIAEHRSDGTVVWRLTGEAGFRYLIERQTDGVNWRPLLLLDNVTGTVTFSDPGVSDANVLLYRSRMLD